MILGARGGGCHEALWRVLTVGSYGAHPRLPLCHNKRDIRLLAAVGQKVEGGAVMVTRSERQEGQSAFALPLTVTWSSGGRVQGGSSHSEPLLPPKMWVEGQ